MHAVVCGLVVTSALGCDAIPKCKAGTVRYVGRPPRRLFSYDRSCRGNCFTFPSGGCDESCDEVDLRQPVGAILDRRNLIIADTESVGPGKALLYSFQYVDEAGGSAPVGWGIVDAGPRTYLSNQLDGTARFVMDTMVAEVEVVDVGDQTGVVTVLGDIEMVEIVGETLRADPGRLEVTRVSSDSIAGRFFLGYETATGQPQGEVIGCFNLSVADAVSVGGLDYQVLAP
ncbi:MAG: hypothetical protein V3T05_14440 [Myxococcota bacterium]